MLIQLKNFFKIWDKFSQSWVKTSFTKNWTTIGFLKLFFYISIWVILLFIIIEYIGFLNFKLYNVWVEDVEDFFLELDSYWRTYTHATFNTTYSDIYHDRDTMYWELDWFDHKHRYTKKYFLAVQPWHTYHFVRIGNLIINTDLEYVSDKIRDNSFFFYYFKFFAIIIMLFKIFVSIWVVLVSSFICIHVYFGLNNVYKDYIRDINVTLQLFYLLLSILILVKLFIVCFEYLFLDSQLQYYIHKGIFEPSMYITDNSKDIIILNIIKFSIVYVFIYLFLNFFINKNKIIFSMNLNYIIYSVISFVVFMAITYDTLMIFANIDLYFEWSTFYDSLSTEWNRVMLDQYYWNNLSLISKCDYVLQIFRDIIIVITILTKDAYIIMYDAIFFVFTFYYDVCVNELLLGLIYLIYDLLFS